MIDHPIINQYLFHPRRDSEAQKNNPKNVLISVGNEINIGSRFHLNSHLHLVILEMQFYSV